MNHLLLSPTALSLMTSFIMQLVIVGYLLSRRNKTRSTWLFTGWMACLLLLTVSECLPRFLYAPVGGYIDWIGGAIFAWLGLILVLQLAYSYPRPTYAREAQAALIVTAALGLGLLAMMLFEAIFTAKPAVYNFTQFWYSLGVEGGAGAVYSFNLFDILHGSGQVWVLGIWLRKTVAFSAAESLSEKELRPVSDRAGGHGQETGPSAGQFQPLDTLLRSARALWRPQGKDATATRAFALLSGLALLDLLAYQWDMSGVLAGGFSALYLVVIFGFVVTYLNHAPEPSTLVVRLVGLTLVTLLAVMRAAIPLGLDLSMRADEEQRQAELAYVGDILAGADKRLADIPSQVQYIAARPAEGGLFPASYQLLFSRDEQLSAQVLLAQDAHVQERLARAQPDLMLENPWLGPIVTGQEQLQTISARSRQPPPARVRSYRGVYDRPEAQYLRYTLRSSNAGLLYEVGYSYLAYRQKLQRAALPLLYLILGGSLFVLFVFPRFFRMSLIRPLEHLLGGVRRVNAGDLDVAVPVTLEDEIGFLTRSFNKMVSSLRVTEGSLRSEITERQRAEDEVRDLNATLEQRVAARTRELAALYEVSAVASQATDTESMMAESLARTMAVMSSTLGAIYRLETPQDAGGAACLRLTAQQGIPPAYLPQMRSLPAEDGPAGWVIKHGQPLLIADAAAGPDIYPALRWASAMAFLLAPMRAEGQVLGGLLLGRQAAAGFTLEEVALLATIADELGLAVQSDRLRQQSAVLAERERLARDLHDSVTQSLYGLATLSEAGLAQLENGAYAACGRTLTRVGATTRQALTEMRLFIHQLRPPVLAQEGLVAALRLRLATVERHANLHARLIAEDALRLPPPVADALYQIAQEALNNVLKHAQAAAVTVTIAREATQVVLEVVDDGRGFDLAQADAAGGVRGLGLPNMRERARRIGGAVAIRSTPGGGTCVQATVPLVE